MLLNVFSSFDGCLVQRSPLFGKGSSKKHFCEIVLKFWPWRRCCLNVCFFFVVFFVALVAILFILAILVEGQPRNISVKLF